MQASNQADKIIEFTLRHVPFDGWTMDALRRGAVDAGENPDDAVRLFKSSHLNMIEYYSQMLDRQMVSLIEKENLEEMKIRERIATCVIIRLKLMEPYRESVQKASIVLALPQNTPLATKLMYQTVSKMWYCAGDTSTDYNFYTKRGLLSLVYSSTLLYWFRDTSLNFTDTQSFLRRRIENVLAIPKVTGQVKKVFDTLTKPLRGFWPTR